MDIDKLIKEATLKKDGTIKEVYRAIKAELLLNKTSKNPKPNGRILYTLMPEDCEKIEINELDLSIVRKLIKEREEQISMYDANSRKDLADMYREQKSILEVLLPPEVSEDQIQEFITTAHPNGYSQKEMGKIIKEVKDTYPTANPKLIADLVKKHIV